MTVPSVAAVLLAAGASQRMGQCKQKLVIDGISLLRRSCLTLLTALAGKGPLIVVLGARADELRRELFGLELSIVDHTQWSQGMMSSVQAGLAAAQSADFMLLALADQPRLSSDDYGRLMAQRCQRYGAQVVASTYAATVGVPALFPRAYYRALANASASAGGAKQLILSLPHRTIPMPNAALDLDTLEDYRRYVENPGKLGHWPPA